MSFWEELKKRNVVRVAALYVAASWLILQVADLVVEAYELPQWTMRVLISLLAIGLPATLALAWIFEIPPDGIRREADGDIRRTGGRRLTLAIGVLVALSVAMFLFVRPVVDPPNETAGITEPFDAPPGSIAVMPFVNISEEAGNDYFSDGLSSELMGLLADVPELRVTARSSSFYFKGKDVRPAEVGRMLNVSHILEGEVRKAGQRLRISVQLIDTATGYQVWRNTYDRTLNDVFELQNEIAAATVDGLRVSVLGDPPRARETDPEAFNAYLSASYFYGRRSPDGYARAIEYLERSIDLDAEFPPAWTLLASTYINQAIIGSIPFEEGYRNARKAVETALQIDPGFSYANASRAWQAMYFERDYVTAANFFRRAMELAPNDAIVLSNVAVFASITGQLDTSIRLTQQSIARNPVSSVSFLNLSGAFNRAGHYSEAIDAANRALELNPGMVSALVNLCEAYLLSEQPAAAMEYAGSIDSPRRTLQVRALLYAVVDRQESDLALAAIIDEYATDSAFDIARIYAWRGEFDQAFDWLTRAINEDQNILGVRSDPMLRSLHGDPRWDALLDRLGLSNADVAALTI